MRFDLFASKKLNISRNKTLELIENKEILLNGKTYKASFDVSNLCENLNDDILFNDELKLELLQDIYVSRAAFKLKYFLDEINLDINNKICLDIGSSSGGFAQILLEKNAKIIYCVDVGNEQLDKKLINNEKIKLYENTDIREFQSYIKFDLITCDVSFISLKNIIFYINNFAKDNIILLFKPQFEVGKNAKRDKKGVVKNEKDILQAKSEFEKECMKYNWVLQKKSISNLKGKNGNVEYFYLFSKK